jgi:hypothetical protein
LKFLSDRSRLEEKSRQEVEDGTLDWRSIHLDRRAVGAPGGFGIRSTQNAKGTLTANGQTAELKYACCYKALMAGDIETVKKWVVRERAAALEKEDPQKIIESFQIAQPREISIVSVKVEGETATLTAKGEIKDGSATGTVSMALEDGVWKVLKESRSITSK